MKTLIKGIASLFALFIILVVCAGALGIALKFLVTVFIWGWGLIF